jgi:hypothetical protein
VERSKVTAHNGNMPNGRIVLQIELSAVKPGVSPLTVLLACLTTPPLRTLIDRAVEGNWETINWRISVEIIGTISGLWFVGLFASNPIDSRGADYRENTHKPSFPATTFIRIIYLANVFLSGVLFWGLGKEHDPVWTQWFGLAGPSRTVRSNPSPMNETGRPIKTTIRHTSIRCDPAFFQSRIEEPTEKEVRS